MVLIEYIGCFAALPIVVPGAMTIKEFYSIYSNATLIALSSRIFTT